MRKISYLLSAFSIIAMTVFTGCKKDEETNPTAPSNAKVFTSTMTTTNGGNSGTAIVTGNVTASDSTVILRLDVTSSTDLDQIFIMKSVDNGDLTPVQLGNITANGKTFTGNSSKYTLKVPSSVQSFVIDIPVKVRTSPAAVSDVYYIWITNNKLLGSGSFSTPTKNRELGPSTITLNYTTSTLVPFSTGTVDVGSQSSADSSFLVTSGLVTTLGSATFNSAPASADIQFITLTGGKKDNLSTSLFMYSPADAADANPPANGATIVVPSGANHTTFATYTAKAFSAVTGSDLQAITGITATNIQVTAGNTYAFKTAAGKVGVIKINSITADTDNTNAGGENANVSIKVLN